MHNLEFALSSMHERVSELVDFIGVTFEEAFILLLANHWNLEAIVKDWSEDKLKVLK